MRSLAGDLPARALCLAVGLLTTGLGCAWLISSQREIELGAEFARDVEAQLGIAEAGPASGWVEAVGARLARRSPRQDVPYVFQVVDMPEPNAFALPGGFVYVSRGLLALVNDESELAGVVGHEIGHVVAKHSLRRATASTPFAVVFGIPSRIVGMVSGTLGGVIGGIGSVAEGALVAPYGRSQEHEADRIGQGIAAAAGYDPAGLSRLLESLEREQALAAGGPPRWSFFATHPATPDRVERTTRFAETLERGAGAPLAGTRGAVLARLEGLLVGANPAEGVFVGQRFLHPDLEFELTFPRGWIGVHGRTGVAAQPPDDPDTGVLLQVAALGEDPVAAAREDGFGGAELSRLELDGLAAARAVREERGTRVWVTWAGLDGRVYRMIGIAPAARAAARQPEILATHDGFRRLSSSARAEVRALRIRSRQPQPGEALDAFARRTGSAWSPAQIAVANGLPQEARPDPAVALKIAASEAYAKPR